MRAQRDFPDITSPEQEQTLAFDFGKFLATGVTLTGTPTVTCERVDGDADATPSARFLSSPQISVAPILKGGSGIADTAILIRFGGCPGTTRYRLQAGCAATDGDTPVLVAFIKSVLPADVEQ